MGRRHTFVIFWLPPALWAGLIFVLSHIPGNPDRGIDIPGLDKVVHGIFFGILAFLLYRAFHGHAGLTAWAAAICAFGLTVVYGAIDEYHQSFVIERSSDVRDWIADSVGAVAAVVYAMYVRKGPTREQD